MYLLCRARAVSKDSYTVSVYDRIQAVGVADCRINATDASLRIFEYVHVSRVRVCPSSAVSEYYRLLTRNTSGLPPHANG